VNREIAILDSGTNSVGFCFFGSTGCAEKVGQSVSAPRAVIHRQCPKEDTKFRGTRYHRHRNISHAVKASHASTPTMMMAVASSIPAARGSAGGLPDDHRS
jgi:hypothetical protein